MLKNLLRRHLPDHHAVRRHRLGRLFGPALHSPGIWHLNRRSVAGGVAVGLFTGLVPGPFQMLAAALLAVLFRVNLPTALACTLYTNPFTFVPLYLLAYQIGALVTGAENHGPVLAAFDWHALPWADILPAFFHWVSGLGGTLLIGLILQGALFAALGYAAVRLLWRIHIVRHWRRRQAARAPLTDR